jgi:Tol biopolymer transport system component
VEHWKPAAVSSPQFESHAAFDPRTGDLYFVRSSPAFEGWRILVAPCTAAGWGAPVPPPFAGPGLEADPYFSPDGRSLYFISTRATGSARSADLDIWWVERTDEGRWGSPVRLPSPVNSSAAEWFPRLGADGWLYFGSGREGGLGGTDIWRARAGGDETWAIANLGDSVNSAGHEFEAQPSPDGSRLIVMTDLGLYEARKSGARFSPRVRLGPEVNANGTEVGALFSPSGRSLLFSRDTKGPDSGEFFVWRDGGAEDWPPLCPAQR